MILMYTPAIEKLVDNVIVEMLNHSVGDHYSINNKYIICIYKYLSAK